MQDMTDYLEPIRDNKGKVDWTLLPWDEIMLSDLVEILNYYNLSRPEILQKCIIDKSITKDVINILAISLLLHQGDVGARKYVLWNLPWSVLEQVCRVFAYGTIKYARDNYKLAPGLPLESYIQSIWRHLVEYLKGNLVDEESKLPHLAHVAANCFMYLWTKREYYSDLPTTK